MIEVLKQALEALEATMSTHGFREYIEEAQEKAITSLRQAIAELESQEPVVYLSNKRQRLNIELKPHTFVGIPTATDWEMPLYTHPPQRTWQGLTDEEIQEIALELPMDAVRITEAKLKEKNT